LFQTWFHRFGPPSVLSFKKFLQRKKGATLELDISMTTIVFSAKVPGTATDYCFAGTKNFSRGQFLAEDFPAMRTPPGPMDTPTLDKVLRQLKKEIQRWKVPAVGVIAERAIDRPFETLVSTILSLRTKDKVTEAASHRLLARSPTPEILASLPTREIEQLIYPVGFYRTKAGNLRDTCRSLLDDYGGRVPRSMDQLLKLRGVGRKTANLVLTVGFGDYGICVDTHVHRISNLWGYVRTRTPEETEFALRAKLPRRHWKTFNDILVTFGQNLCLPVSPWCSKCPVARHCPRIGLRRSR
jgi:endonuclease-3